MSDKKFKEKYNEGCVKIFKLLQLLYDDKADYDSVTDIFSNDDCDAEKQHVTLNKFLNTLKIFGMKIQKSNNKFKSLNMPFTLSFDIDDLKAINLLSNVATSLPDSDLKLKMNDFIQMMQSRFDEKSWVLYQNILNTDNTNYAFYYSDLKSQIEMCEKYCNSMFKVYVKYKLNGKEVSTYCNAKQVIFDNKNAYLKIFKIVEKEYEDILITNIIEIKYSPSPRIENEIANSVVFKLKGRLAKSYTLHENERIESNCEDGSIVVMNSDEPVDILLKRLMRYDNDCVILRPKTLKDKMLALINDTLKNYE